MDNPELRNAKAISFLMEGSQFDGAHHKAWIIDQVMRILAGDRYDSLIAEHNYGDDGPETYDWDEGIPP